ncbi:hypothetical protein DV736_g4864, partial [Chaetothyriales sp. CBS 134916]
MGPYAKQAAARSSRQALLPPEVISDSSEGGDNDEYRIFYDVATKTVPKAQLGQQLEEGYEELLTKYLRHTLVGFHGFPQAWVLWLVAGRERRRTFAKGYVAKLPFETGDVVNGVYKVLGRDGNVVVFGMTLGAVEGRLVVSIGDERERLDARTGAWVAVQLPAHGEHAALLPAARRVAVALLGQPLQDFDDALVAKQMAADGGGRVDRRLHTHGAFVCRQPGVAILCGGGRALRKNGIGALTGECSVGERHRFVGRAPESAAKLSWAMANDFANALLKRTLGEKRSDRSIKTLYGHKSWVEDLDIVNELGGHNGCVNALSWSSSGNLLASGSDDTFINIWSYNPTNLAKPFTLNTSVSTGHHANIFSVKFMPCSGDRTVDFFAQARWLSDANTNARVYRCHADRAKRIVTESSPFLFLTCSEDGEVRQWDLRLPSSAYPAPRGGRGFARLRHAEDEASDNVPPPLISYKKYDLDLNSISCAASRPHYIALGGAHLHCFLHDRRMLGRDLACEAGHPGYRTPVAGTHEDETMSSATRCVKRFAPNERRRMNSRDYGHITACKISDANPNEMVASWSGDHVYSFDLVKSPDARDADVRKDEVFQASRLKNQTDRKRKRKHATASSSSLAENTAPSRRLRRVSDSVPEGGQTTLRVRDDMGDGEDISPITTNEEETTDGSTPVADVLLSEAQVTAERVARGIVRLRKTLFDFSAALREESALDTVELMENSADLTPYTSHFTDALGQCASLLPQLDEIIRGWTYPIAPTSEDVTLQNTLRRNRQSTWRFVQASGCLSYVLGGQLQTSGEGSDPRLHLFSQIRPAVHEGKTIRRDSMFCYDFLKAILCWVDGGALAVLNAFTRPPSIPPESARFPLSDSDTLETFVPKLHEYLYELADESKPIIDLDTNYFEHDERRQVFHSQKSAVQAFTRALSGIELRMGQGASIDMSTTSIDKRIMNKGAAARFWAVNVGRSLLMEAAEGVTFDFVNRACGGLRLQLPSPLGAERSQEDIDPDEREHTIEAVGIVRTSQTRRVSSIPAPAVAVENVPESDDDQEDSNEHDISGDEEPDDDDDDEESAQAMIRRGIAFGSRSRERALVNINVPYSSHSQTYKGHCNTRTVKDVNYYGLNDEDRKTGKIVNILEGDGEVVNVIQGHPYEPMIACSGIDSTIKIFGPGGLSRERRNAARDIDIANPSGGKATGCEDDQFEVDDEADEPKVRRNGLHSRRAMHRMYEITSRNDVDRRHRLGGVSMTLGWSRQACQSVPDVAADADSGREVGVGISEGDILGPNLVPRGQVRVAAGQGLDGGGGMITISWVTVEELPLYLQRAILESSLLTRTTEEPEPGSGPARVRVLDLEGLGKLKANEEQWTGLLLLRHCVTQVMGGDVLRPELILKRARCHEALGYDELAVGDAYAAFTLASGESEDLVGRTVGADGVEQWDVDGRVAAEVRVGTVRLLVRGLRRLGVVEGLEGIYGRCQRVVYPWNSHEPDRMSAASLAEINERLHEASDGMLDSAFLQRVILAARRRFSANAAV